MIIDPRRNGAGMMTFVRTLDRWLGRARDVPGPTFGPSPPVVLWTRPDRTGGDLPGVGVEEILARHSLLIDRIRVGYAGAEGSFETHVEPVIRRFAAFVHLLPATSDGHFREPGGCLRCGLEVGLHALQAVDGQIFHARGTVPERRAAAPRWRAAALAMGLCMEIHRPLFGSAVRDAQGMQWNPLLAPLLDWLREGGRQRYSIEWPREAAPGRSATLAVLPQILGPSMVAFLAEGDRSILDHLLAGLGAPPGSEASALGATVEQTLSRVVARNLRHAPPPRPSMLAGEAEQVPAQQDPGGQGSGVASETVQGPERTSTAALGELATPDVTPTDTSECVVPNSDLPSFTVAAPAVPSL